MCGSSRILPQEGPRLSGQLFLDSICFSGLAMIDFCAHALTFCNEFKIKLVGWALRDAWHVVL